MNGVFFMAIEYAFYSKSNNLFKHFFLHLLYNHFFDTNKKMKIKSSKGKKHQANLIFVQQPQKQQQQQNNSTKFIFI